MTIELFYLYGLLYLIVEIIDFGKTLRKKGSPAVEININHSMSLTEVGDALHKEVKSKSQKTKAILEIVLGISFWIWAGLGFYFSYPEKWIFISLFLSILLYKILIFTTGLYVGFIIARRHRGAIQDDVEPAKQAKSLPFHIIMPLVEIGCLFIIMINHYFLNA